MEKTKAVKHAKRKHLLQLRRNRKNKTLRMDKLLMEKIKRYEDGLGGDRQSD
tara:strand:- start:5842 stop:5997 length:156 start_codon:yes stop_codon:yes gene_type:complete